ncbi:MAG: hypothetical protein A3F31_01135 [Candidatus Levybacteria bacterium RIFCSPHIGHO2_12_FULL_38_12]|nr:MAG: hypothetical protein A2770_01795 [Candidatus Levybacteria bacterium RIFCSPHIGHO2_01_FULL_38_12]OGH22029.1 MAG: hypothetical protein A3D75_03325 [Candidatus Levybacteria bacterium RIFCSPHIGHO2_02_FULL_37_18]OGH23253.1 MAG: hypothetical protein A3F31_01135 [Candidatus Levybacteria bacterium RIFCSPHIGHO2_12_FULL_38_12]OGH33722.1 MAG: hypothetical protein A3A47_02760 [Candidatus Levybacteria bacterium RIFCSPLOWO2_01_FULL_37_20]OGH44628.1 MAG: hypothetical protein A3J14_00845 [Candidatus Lev
MKIGIIGAGFTGLSAGIQLLKKGHSVTIFEKDKNPGGLALGYKENKWQWSLEEHYHHWFTNDSYIVALAKEIKHEVIIQEPKTSVYVDNTSYQLDSPIRVLSFPKLSFFERVQMGIALGIFRFNPFWKPLEQFRASDVLSKLMGEVPYKLLWEPLLKNKFGNYADDVSLAWFWARIYKRTKKLAYPKGGFLEFANKLVEYINNLGGTVIYNSPVENIKSNNDSVSIKTNNKSQSFDKIIVTLPSQLFTKTASIPFEYKQSLEQLKSLGAVNLVLRLKEEFLKDGTYWLSMCDANIPFLAIIEHTHFMDKKSYNNEYIVYIGKYLPSSDPFFSKSKEEIFNIYDPFLAKITKNYKKSIIDYRVFKAPFAQPIIPIHYSKVMPSFKTPLQGVYLANIQQVYPWDRGTNYAVGLGQKIATFIENDR